jgi:hypothetical protein
VPSTRSHTSRGRSSAKASLGVAAGQHVQHGVVRRAGQRGERRRLPHQVQERIDVPVVERHHRDDLLGQHVERVSRVAHRLDLAAAHPLRDDSGLHQVAAVLREQHAV